ncbi:alpha/beta fold hydrolase [Pseudomonas sp. TTU2014-080ASC]|uniref:alpha/beta fold hydrolase n=1 Tax=Pseudomonas sp. TTU2014-080ASC TaxID=1729724 RepID=UPI0007189A9F|nr:alpha/beta fold hydrolase [Pseudomonas sp. TTU2014-080ASC]KRW62494.1 alpha/beta hydrolase [Pseudomonas sp. TTU2014-080ASC]
MKRFARIVLIALALMALTFAIAAISSWAPDREVAELKQRWAQPPSQFVAIDGMLVHVRDQGPRDDPAPVVLLHGTSASLHTWEGWAAVLQDKRRVISLDLPGFGLTGPFPDGDYRISHYTQFLGNLLDHLQVNKAVLIGNSFGGQLAWQFSLAQPQRVNQLVLVDAAGYPRAATSVPIGFRVAQIPALAPLMTKLLPRSMIESSIRNVYGDPAKVSEDLIDRYYELTLRSGNREALRQRFIQASSDEDYKAIARIQVPTLILWGGRDELIPQINAEHFKRDIKGSRLVIFDQLGHVPQEEDPLQSLAPVLSFIAR